MLKIMIADEKENADIIAAILKGHYEIIVISGEKGLKERLYVEKPDMLLITADYDYINYRKVLGDIIRRDPEYTAMPAAIISALPTQAVVTTASDMNAEVILRPFEPLDFVARIHKMGENLKPLKERIDFVTGLHKREYTEEQIIKLFPKKSGTLFIVDVAKFRFASQPISEQVSAKFSAAVIESVKIFNAILGVQKDRKLIGYLPDVDDPDFCLNWANDVIKNIKEHLGDDKVYVSIGFASNNEKAADYTDLYQRCDRALNLAREKGSNRASYY